ncbi:MAG: hypothetical protein NVS2B4_21960 [Ramlibacter sp.]
MVPLMPAFIAPQDGHDKQDCERAAAKRWLTQHAARMKDLRPIYLGDDLFACQPIAQAVLDSGGDFLFTAKPTSHKALYDFMQGAEAHQHTVVQKSGRKRTTLRYRWFEHVPQREGKDALLVNWIGVEIADHTGKTTYRNAFVTSLDVSRDTVATTVACARARWKIENESFNVLKNNGYHMEHNFGHGKIHLAMMFAAMNLLAFAMHTVCDCLEALWINKREAKRARKRLFEHIRTITAYLVFRSRDSLITTIITSKPPPENQGQIGA